MGDCVVGSCLFVFGYLALRRDLGKVVTVLRDRKMLLWLSASAVLISANWLLYVWAVTANHIVETSLGYFINPLVSVLFGVFILRERDRKSVVAGKRVSVRVHLGVRSIIKKKKK